MGYWVFADNYDPASIEDKPVLTPEQRVEVKDRIKTYLRNRPTKRFWSDSLINFAQTWLWTEHQKLVPEDDMADIIQEIHLEFGGGSE